MANLQELIPAFFTGPNGQRLTPEQIAQRQEVAQSLLGRATDTRPDAGGWASVLTKGLLGYKSGADNRAADAAIAANADASQQSIAAMLGGLTGGGAYPSAVAGGQSPTSGAATGTPVSIPSAPEIRQGLIDRGLQPHIADAFILNFQDESGLNPGINEQNPTVPGSRGGFGLYQLTGPRRREYEAFAAQRGVDPADTNAQLDFLMMEGGGSEKAAFDKILSSPDTASAAQAIVNSFLRPAEQHRASRSAKYGRVANTPQEAIEVVAPIEQGDENPVNGYVDPIVAPGASFGDRWNAGAVAPVQKAVTEQVQPQYSPGQVVTGPDGKTYQNVEQLDGSYALSAYNPNANQPSASPELLAQNDMMLGGSLSPSGTSPVAQALSGYFPDAPTMQPNAQTQTPQAMGGINPAVIQALSDPYASPQQRQVASMLLGQQMEQAQAAQQQQQLMQQRQATAQTLGINPALAGDPDAWKAAIDQATRNRNTATVGGSLIDANTGQPIYQAPQERFTSITGSQAQQLGLDPNKAYNVGPDGKITPIAESGVTVNVGGGEKLDEEFAKLDAKSLADVSTSGMQAQRNLGRIGQLESLLKSAPNGFGALAAQRAGEWGINTEGLDSIQAAQAVINSLVPEQRPAGSGPMSDADLELFKQSLPRIINTPQGNQTIIDTMRGIAQYDAKGAEIIQRFRKGELNRSQAFEELHNRPNPLANFKPAPQANNSGSDGWRDAGNGVRIRPKGSN